MPDRAIDEFERAVLDPALDHTAQARLHLSSGIVHFQEGRYQVAVVKAEKAVELIDEAGPLRSKALFLWGESLYRLGSPGGAAERYSQALAEGAPEDKPEIHFAIGVCERRLGRLELAREHFEKVPLRHERTAETMRHLAELALEAKNYPSAAFWLTRGRSEHPDRFLDSWTDYALVRAAIHRGDLSEVRELRSTAQSKYPASDGWLTLLNAAAEAYEWQVLQR
jgi:tetratricopeptide (TPR) repeat protein